MSAEALDASLNQILAGNQAQPLVNEKPSGAAKLDQALGGLLEEQDIRHGIKPPEQLAAEKQAAERQAKLPKTWFGELGAGAARGVDQLQELGYGLGVLYTNVGDMPKLREWFTQGVEQQERDLAENPATVPTYDKIDGFDSFMRYALGGVGELAPQFAESVVSGAVGAAVGSSFAPGPGTVIGGVAGFVERQAVKNLVKAGIDKNLKKEMIDFARGRIMPPMALSETAQNLLVNETKNLMSKYGAWGAVGLSSWGKETGSIYNDLKEDDNITESDRKASAIIGGLVAALPDTALQGYIASKFFPGIKNVKPAEVKEATSYLNRFVRAFAKDVPKYGVAEGGQELAQTFVEEAAKNYADPAKRDAVFSFTPEQRTAMIDAMFKGAVGGAAMGGGAATLSARAHPDPMVRKFQAQTTEKAADLDPSILSGEDTPEDIRLAEIAKRKDEIEKAVASGSLKPEEFKQLEEEMKVLQAEEDTLLAEEPLVNEKENAAGEEVKKEEKKPVRTMTPLEREVSHLRAFYGQQMPNREGLPERVKADAAAVKKVDKQVENLVNESTKDFADQGKAATYKDAIDRAITPDIRNFLASEGVTLQVSDSFSVTDDGADGLILTIQDAASFFKAGVALTTSKNKAKATTDYLTNIPSVMAHEVVHLADQVALRNEWKEKKTKQSFSEYERDVMKARGKMLRESWKALPFQVKGAYAHGNEGTVTDRELGQEFIRMMVEYARTGTLSEVTEALTVAEREKGGVLTDFLRVWMEALKKIHAAITKYLDPTQAPAELMVAYDQINKTLDKYGLLVNESAKPEALVDEKVITEPKEAPSITVGQSLKGNVKVEFQGKRGRLWENQKTGELMLRTAKEDVEVSEKTNPEMPLSVLGVRAVRPSKAAEAIAKAEQENTPSEVQKAMKEVEIENEPGWYRDASTHPLLHQIAEARSSEGLTEEMLDRAENIVVSTAERVEQMEATPERKQAMIEPYEDLWHHIESLRKELNEKATAPEPEAVSDVQAEDNPAPSEPAATPEVPEVAKKRRTRQEVAQEKLAKAIKDKDLVVAMQSYIKLRELDGKPPTAKEFKEMYGKGATLKAFNEFLSLTRKTPAKSSSWMDDAMDDMRARGWDYSWPFVPADLYNADFVQLIKEDPELSQSVKDRILAFAGGNMPPVIAPQTPPGVKFDGVFMGKLWQFTNQNEGQPTFGRTFTTPIGATAQEIAQALQEVNDAEANAEVVDLDALLGGLGFPTEPKPPAKAQSPRVSMAERAELNRMLRESATNSAQMAGTLRPGRVEVKPVQGDVLYEGADPRELEYLTRPRTQGQQEATKAIVDNGGALRVGEKLLEDRLGTFLNLTEDETGLNVGPNPKLGWVYDDVARQLYATASKLERGDGSRAMISYLRGLANQLKDTIMMTRNTAGALNDSSGKIMENMDSAQALEHIRHLQFSHAEKVLGKNARANIEALAKKLNDSLVNEMPNFIKSSKFISAIRRMMKMVTSARWEKGMRKTVIANVKTLHDLAKKAAARMAQYTGLDKDSNAYTEEYITRLVKEMSGIPKEANSKEEVQVVRETLGKVVREVGKEMEFITPRPKAEKLSMQKQMAIVLKNEGMYGEFARSLREAYIKEYGGVAPSPEFLAEAELVYARVANRMYDTESLSSLVNEKLRDFNLKIADIAKKGYYDGEANIEMIRRDIKAFMEQEGVKNEGLVDQLVEDLESSMRERLDKARNKFFGSAKTIKEALGHFGVTLTDAVTDYTVNPDKMIESFTQYLSRRFGFPDTADLPMASYFADLMAKSLGPMVADQNSRLLQRWLDQAQKQVDDSKKSAVEKANDKRKLASAVDKVFQLSKAGVMEQEDIYNALQPLFDLPKWNPEVARKIMHLGDKMEGAKSSRQKDIIKQELSDLLSQHKPLKTSDAYISWMYFSMLSGPGTAGVNFAGNFLGLMSYLSTEFVKHPQRLPQMMRAIIRAAVGSGAAEFRESWFWGTALGKDGNKYFKGKNVAEMEDPYFESKLAPGLKQLDEGAAQFTHWLLHAVSAKHIGRILTATDMWFYKIAQEMALASRGVDAATPQMVQSSLVMAREEMLSQGLNPDENAANRARAAVLANSFLDEMRMESGDPALVNERKIAWQEAHQEALEATFQQEPTGFLGEIAKNIERATNEYPIGKMLIPFTRVAANVTNFMIDWTPLGLSRYLIQNVSSGENPFKLMEDGKYNAHIDTLIRFVLGSASTMILALMAGQNADEDDPDFMIYGDGPRDLTLRRMMMDKGWKPNSVKIGGTYYSYIYWPTAMALSIIGRQFDNYREGRIKSPWDVSLATTAVALLEAVKNQSFLVSVADLFGAIDSANPERNLSRLGARLATIPIPNILKQTDKLLDPSIQQSEAFFEYVIKEMPIARWKLDPALNYFGQPIERSRGVIPLPGFDRFATFEKTQDPVLNLISERGFKLPGYSKSTRLNGKPIGEHYTEYVALAGPRIYKRLQAEVLNLREMDRGQAQDVIEQIATEEKAQARLELEEKYSR